MKRKFPLFEIVLLIALISVSVLPIAGYVVNLYKLTQLDFKAPYKAEVLRGVGVVVPPLGCFFGLINIEDK